MVGAILAMRYENPHYMAEDSGEEDKIGFGPPPFVAIGAEMINAS
jgi:hypothetical protein